jgi:hypothetical protein
MNSPLTGFNTLMSVDSVEMSTDSCTCVTMTKSSNFALDYSMGQNAR